VNKRGEIMKSRSFICTVGVVTVLVLTACSSGSGHHPAAAATSQAAGAAAPAAAANPVPTGSNWTDGQWNQALADTGTGVDPTSLVNWLCADTAIAKAVNFN
jgi:hypothetical protein